MISPQLGVVQRAVQRGRPFAVGGFGSRFFLV